MKACPLCGSTYADRVDFCFKDGAPLVAAPEGEGASPLPTPADPPVPAAPPVASFTEAHTGPIPGLADESDLPEPAGLVARQQALSSGAADLPSPRLLPASQGPEEGETSQVPTVAPTAPGPGFDDEVLAPPRALPSSASPFSAPTLVPQAGEGGDESLPGAVPLEAPTPSTDTPVAPEAAVDTGDFQGPSGEDAFFQDNTSTFDAPGNPGGAPLESEEQPRRRGVPWIALAVAAMVLFAVGGGALLGTSPTTDEQAAQPSGQPVSAPATAAPATAAPAPQPPEPASGPSEAAPPAAPAGEPQIAEPQSAGPQSAGSPQPGVQTAPQPGVQAAPQPASRPGAATPAARPTSPPPAPVPQRRPAATPPATEAAPAGAGGSPWGAPTDSGEAALNISSKPSGAKIYVDGVMVGTAPLGHTVGFGSHEIRAEMEGYRTATRSLDAQAASVSVPLELQPAVVLGAVNILGVTGATVTIDGNVIGTIPTIAQLSEGKHTFRVAPKTGDAFTRVLDIQFPGPGKAFTVDLQP